MVEYKQLAYFFPMLAFGGVYLAKPGAKPLSQNKHILWGMPPQDNKKSLFQNIMEQTELMQAGNNETFNKFLQELNKMSFSEDFIPKFSEQFYPNFVKASFREWTYKFFNTFDAGKKWNKAQVRFRCLAAMESLENLLDLGENIKEIQNLELKNIPDGVLKVLQSCPKYNDSEFRKLIKDFQLKEHSEKLNFLDLHVKKITDHVEALKSEIYASFSDRLDIVGPISCFLSMSIGCFKMLSRMKKDTTTDEYNTIRTEVLIELNEKNCYEDRRLLITTCMDYVRFIHNRYKDLPDRHLWNQRDMKDWEKKFLITIVWPEDYANPILKYYFVALTKAWEKVFDGSAHCILFSELTTWCKEALCALNNLLNLKMDMKDLKDEKYKGLLSEAFKDFFDFECFDRLPLNKLLQEILADYDTCAKLDENSIQLVILLEKFRNTIQLYFVGDPVLLNFLLQFLWMVEGCISVYIKSREFIKHNPKYNALFQNTYPHIIDDIADKIKLQNHFNIFCHKVWAKNLSKCYDETEHQKVCSDKSKEVFLNSFYYGGDKETLLETLLEKLLEKFKKQQIFLRKMGFCRSFQTNEKNNTDLSQEEQFERLRSLQFYLNMTCDWIKIFTVESILPAKDDVRLWCLDMLTSLNGYLQMVSVFKKEIANDEMEILKESEKSDVCNDSQLRTNLSKLTLEMRLNRKEVNELIKTCASDIEKLAYSMTHYYPSNQHNLEMTLNFLWLCRACAKIYIDTSEIEQYTQEQYEDCVTKSIEYVNEKQNIEKIKHIDDKITGLPLSKKAKLKDQDCTIDDCGQFEPQVCSDYSTSDDDLNRLEKVEPVHSWHEMEYFDT